jgi:ribosomal protein S18 acetylase RimI-like enzyme
VVVDATGRITGHACLNPIQRDEDDELSAWRPLNEMRWSRIAVLDADALALLAAGTRERYPADVWTLAVTVPSIDGAAPELFARVGLAPRSNFATCAVALPPADVFGVLVRPVTPADATVLLELLDEMIAFQVGHTPIARALPVLATSFEQRLVRSFSGEPAATGTPQVVVAEADGRVVGYTESWLVDVDDKSWSTPGRYGYLNSVAVTADYRGRGVGRALASATMQLLATYDVAAYSLWFNADNPIASQVWPRLGFTPLWTTYLP